VNKKKQKTSENSFFKVDNKDDSTIDANEYRNRNSNIYDRRNNILCI